MKILNVKWHFDTVGLTVLWWGWFVELESLTAVMGRVQESFDGWSAVSNGLAHDHAACV